MNKINYHIVSKRKTTVARIYMKYGKGNIIINNKSITLYFKNNIYFLFKIKLILNKIKFFKHKKYDFFINIYGGGNNSQIESIIYGIIKLLYLHDKKYLFLKNNLFLRNDNRKVERKKFGKKKARKSFQFSKR
ncbi:MAG: 30S ribosomal protein S9 [Candidatus Shikimatogenerans sp. Tser]|uniref:Small ribosomal subunit protein uS9 n=1 Tax=Candidatus Shikimatogenerans sp. Tser TaxID=3158568 RepID=A0AAU7QRD6_9FLAO